ncbi:hypothetical protein GCM10023321_50540 [Pseudonocardia eucalypti]|uniref:Uncharacterized protein n=1 Tax=Pseudonocardia eucalypti TaxID=648755 RepID=A0ABP9QKG3_9PSEU
MHGWRLAGPDVAAAAGGVILERAVGLGQPLGQFGLGDAQLGSHVGGERHRPAGALLHPEHRVHHLAVPRAVDRIEGQRAVRCGITQLDHVGVELLALRGQLRHQRDARQLGQVLQQAGQALAGVFLQLCQQPLPAGGRIAGAVEVRTDGRLVVAQRRVGLHGLVFLGLVGQPGQPGVVVAELVLHGGRGRLGFHRGRRAARDLENRAQCVA